MDAAALDARLSRFFARGRARWPDLELREEGFTAAARAQVEKLAHLDEERVCAEDLYLVTACLLRIPGALDRFEALTWPQLARHLRRVEERADRLDDLHQLLLIKLFVGDQPRAAEFTGLAPLSAWLRMIAARMAIDARRGTDESEALGESYAQRAAGGIRDVELSFLRGRYEEDFAAALREALASLQPEERLALRLFHRERMTSDQLATVLQTSRATAHRRVVSAREALAARTRDRLRTRLALTESGVEHLMGLYGSRLVPALSAELRAGLS